MVYLRNNGLTITLMAMFALALIGQWLTGWSANNDELLRHGEAAIAPLAYFGDAAFMSSVFENWESEFLQMAVYVVLTAILVQRGSAESKDPDAPERDADLAAQAAKPGAPRILAAGASARWLYARSLGLTLFALFLLSFLLHWINSAGAAADDAIAHGETPETVLQYFWSAQLWFESLQNWQSEFLSTAVLVVLSIFLRQKESPESKAVAAPHGATGA